MTGSRPARSADHTLTVSHSSPAPPRVSMPNDPDCGGGGPKAVASRTPSQARTGRGGENGTGGAAYGIPRKTASPSSLLPRTTPPVTSTSTPRVFRRVGGRASRFLGSNRGRAGSVGSGALGVTRLEASLLGSHLRVDVALGHEPGRHLLEDGLDLLGRQVLADATAGQTRVRDAQASGGLLTRVGTIAAQGREPFRRVGLQRVELGAADDALLEVGRGLGQQDAELLRGRLGLHGLRLRRGHGPSLGRATTPATQESGRRLPLTRWPAGRRPWRSAGRAAAGRWTSLGPTCPDGEGPP